MKKLLIAMLATLLLIPIGIKAEEVDRNIITIEAVDKESKPLTGFSYTITNQATGDTKLLSLIDRSKNSIKLADGTYTITETTTKDGYKKAQPMVVTIPWKEHGHLKPKHLPESKTTTILEEPKSYANTGSATDWSGTSLLGMAALVTALLGTIGYRKGWIR